MLFDGKDGVMGNPPGPVRQGQRLTADWCNRVLGARGGRRLRVGGVPYRPEEGLPHSRFNFGGEVKDIETVTVMAGYIVTPANAHAVAETDVLIVGAPTAAAPHYTYLSWDIGGDVVASIPTPALAELPKPDGTTYRVPLFDVYYTSGGNLVIGQIHHIGNFHVTYIPTGA